MSTLHVNGKKVEVQSPPDTPLLWVLREELGLTGTKYSCGKGLCGSCTVHVDGEPTRSCNTPISMIEDGAKIVTIETLGESKPGKAVQDAWVELNVVQCGYCQSGQCMAAAALLARKPKPTDNDINSAMINLCRCGTYHRIRQAVHLASTKLSA